jgi:GTP-binding protein EngB required for normal cell division
VNIEQAHHQFGVVLDELLMLFSETADWHPDPAVQSVLTEGVQRAVGIRARVEHTQDRYVVSVVGLSNVGKSTLLNALLGQELAPRRNGPCTTAPIEFEYADSLSVRVSFVQRLDTLRWSCDNAADIHRHLAELNALPADDGRMGEIQKVIVGAPLELLKAGLVIADTPGFGAVRFSDQQGPPESILQRYLKNNISQVFWVVLAEQGIGSKEAGMHSAFFADLCDDIIVTGAEDFDQNDRDRFRHRFTNLLRRGLPPHMFFVSGKRGLEARKHNDQDLLAESGILELTRRIEALGSSTRRLGHLRRSLIMLTRDVRAWWQGHRDLDERRLRVQWRPDSWRRWCATLPKNPFKQRIDRNLRAS